MNTAYFEITSRTHQFAKVVDGVAQKRRNAEVVCAQESLIGSEVGRDVDAGEIEQRVLVVGRIVGLCLRERETA